MKLLPCVVRKLQLVVAAFFALGDYRRRTL
jgi:hypothetical protein